MKYIIHIFLLLACASLHVNATITDSLISELAVADKDTTAVKLNNEIAFQYRNTDIEAAIKHANSALALAKKLKYKRGIIESNYQLAACYYRMDDKKEVTKILTNEVIKLAAEINDISTLSKAYNLKSILEENVDTKIDAINKSLEFAIELDDSLKMLICYNRLGNIYAKDGNLLDKSINFLKKARTISIKLNNSNANNIITANIGTILIQQEKYDEALFYLQSSILSTDRGSNEINWAYAAANLGTAYNHLDRADSAEYYLAEAEQILLKHKDDNLYRVYGNQASLYSNMNKNELAITRYKSLIAYAKTDSNSNILIDYYDGIMQSYYAIGDYKNAYLYADSFNRLNNKLYNDDLLTKISEAEIKFESEKKEKQIVQQNLKIQQQNSQRLRLIIGSILALLSSILIFQFYLQRQKRRKQVAEHNLKLQQAETASLKKLDNLKTQFFTNISHELRTPLTLINGPLENALEKTSSKSQEKDILTAYKNTKKLSNLVDEILDFSKLEAGKLVSHPKKIQLNYFLKRVFFAFESMAELRGIQLKYSSAINEQNWYHIDENHLEKILNNLISNALKFTKRKGSVSLDARIVDNNISIMIKDNGQGIHPDDLPYVFERFYQSEQASETLQGGTGIGLALSKELAELMKGKIIAKSVLNEGSTFELIIPAAETEAGNQEQYETDKLELTDSLFTPLFINGEQPKILIVEDNYEMSRYLNELLSVDYNCHVAYDGEEALKLLKQHQFDLISADIMMPNMDGFTFREEVNKLEHYQDIPFIMLTARAIEADKLKGLQLGVDDYITKPFSKLELKARIYNLLQNKIQRSDWRNNQEEQNETPTVEISFLSQVEQIVLGNIDNTNFKVSELADAMNYSQRQLSRILKKHIGLSPVAYILEIRLQKARQLLEQRKFNSVKEVQFAVGIDSPSYFTTKFKARFGKSPSAYLDGY